MLRTPTQLAALADAAVPAIRPVKVEGLTVPAGAMYQTAHVTGFDGRTWVVRCALTDAAGAELSASDALVQLLDKRVPFDVPRALGAARPSTGPAVVVYPMPRGNALDWNDLAPRSDAARALGLALAQLHGLDPRIVEEAGLPTYDAKAHRRRLEVDLERAAATGKVPEALLARWHAALDADDLWRFATTVTHGPLNGEDVLVEEGEVSAITSWEHAGVADPARDFALLWLSAPQGAFDTVYESYAGARRERPDHNLERRIRLMGELELAYALMRSHTMGHEALEGFYESALHSLVFDVEGDESLLPPKTRGGIEPIALDEVNPADIEAVGGNDLSEEEELTIEIPVRAEKDGDNTSSGDHANPSLEHAVSESSDVAQTGVVEHGEITQGRTGHTDVDRTDVEQGEDASVNTDATPSSGTSRKLPGGATPLSELDVVDSVNRTPDLDSGK